MLQAAAYYFSIGDLEALIKEYSDNKYSDQLGGRTLRGFVFTPGLDRETNTPRVFAFPLFSLPDKNTSEDAVLFQNMSYSTSGCPYPPPCK
jgi:hypothetical protein